MFKNLTVGPTGQWLTRSVLFLFERGKQNGGGGRLRRAYRRRLAAARARGRDGEGAERLGEEAAQLVYALAGHGDLGRHRSVFSGGGSLRLMTDRTLLATVHPGEHDIVTAVLRGASGWRESARGELRCANRAGVGAARVVMIPVRCGSSRLEAVAGGARGSGCGGAAMESC